MTISQKYLEFISLVQALNTIVFGDDTAEVTLDGITKPSISKFLAQVDALTTAELQRLRDAINTIMNQQSVPTTVVNDGTHSQEWINSDFRAALLALNNWINTKGLPNGYASLDANGIIPKEQLPIHQATETALGAAKIATTVIAKAGTNDTDIITAKKLRDVLGVDTQARVNLQTLGIVYQKNIRSITLVSAGVYEVNLLVPMVSTNYNTVGETIVSSSAHANTLLKLDPTFARTTSKFRLNVVSSYNGTVFGVGIGDMFFKVIENV